MNKKIKKKRRIANKIPSAFVTEMFFSFFFVAFLSATSRKCFVRIKFRNPYTYDFFHFLAYHMFVYICTEEPQSSQRRIKKKEPSPVNYTCIKEAKQTFCKKRKKKKYIIRIFYVILPFVVGKTLTMREKKRVQYFSYLEDCFFLFLFFSDKMRFFVPYKNK